MAERQKARFEGFVQYSLTVEDQKEIKKRILTEKTALGLIQTLSEDGYKVSIQHSEESEAYIFTVYAQYRDMEDAGIGVSAFHSDLLTAISVLPYLFDTILEHGNWHNALKRSNKYDW